MADLFFIPRGDLSDDEDDKDEGWFATFCNWQNKVMSDLNLNIGFTLKNFWSVFSFVKQIVDFVVEMETDEDLKEREIRREKMPNFREGRETRDRSKRFASSNASSPNKPAPIPALTPAPTVNGILSDSDREMEANVSW